jgi:hypothetical protein
MKGPDIYTDIPKAWQNVLQWIPEVGENMLCRPKEKGGEEVWPAEMFWTEMKDPKEVQKKEEMENWRSEVRIPLM